MKFLASLGRLFGIFQSSLSFHKKRGWDKSPSLSIVFGLSSKTQWLSGPTTLISSAFTALLNCAEVGRRNRILTNYRFLSHSLFYSSSSAVSLISSSTSGRSVSSSNSRTISSLSFSCLGWKGVA